LAGYVLAEATDGYQVVFSLGELDAAFIDNEMLLADTANGNLYLEHKGVFAWLLPGQLGARSVRMLARLQVVQLRK